MANSVDPYQSAPIGAVCSGSTPFAFILNSSEMLGNYLQQKSFSDAFFFLGTIRVNLEKSNVFLPVSILHVKCNIASKVRSQAGVWK